MQLAESAGKHVHVLSHHSSCCYLWLKFLLKPTTVGLRHSNEQIRTQCKYNPALSVGKCLRVKLYAFDCVSADSLLQTILVIIMPNGTKFLKHILPVLTNSEE